MHAIDGKENANMVLMDSIAMSEHTASQDSKKLKLLSYNVQIGIPTKRYRQYITKSWKHILPFSERQTNLDRIAEFVSDFDIAGLLELDAGSIRSDFIHQPNYIAEKANLPYVYTQTNRNIGVLAKHRPCPVKFPDAAHWKSTSVINLTLWLLFCLICH